MKRRLTVWWHESVLKHPCSRSRSGGRLEVFDHLCGRTWFFDQPAAGPQRVQTGR